MGAEMQQKADQEHQRYLTRLREQEMDLIKQNRDEQKQILAKQTIETQQASVLQQEIGAMTIGEGGKDAVAKPQTIDEIRNLKMAKDVAKVEKAVARMRTSEAESGFLVRKISQLIQPVLTEAHSNERTASKSEFDRVRNEISQSQSQIMQDKLRYQDMFRNAILNASAFNDDLTKARQKKLCGMQKLFQEQQNRFEERKRREMQLKKHNEEHQDEIEKKLLKNSANAQHSNNSRSKYDQHNPYKLRS